MNPAQRESIEDEPKNISILTHRGLEPEKDKYFAESSRESFADQISRGFGLEFDLQATKDGGFAVLHDQTLSRPTEGLDDRKISEVTLPELLKMKTRNSHFVSFEELLRILVANPDNLSINA